MIRQAIFGKIFAAHCWIDNLDVFRTEHALPNCNEPLGQFGIVISRWRELVLEDLDNRCAFRRHSSCSRDTFRDLVNRGEHAIAHIAPRSAHVRPPLPEKQYMPVKIQLTVRPYKSSAH